MRQINISENAHDVPPRSHPAQERIRPGPPGPRTSTEKQPAKETPMTTNQNNVNTPSQGSLAETLEAAHDDLRQAKALITAIADRVPDGYLKWGMAEGEAADALAALEPAPSLPPSSTASTEKAADILDLTSTPTSSLLERIDDLPTRADQISRSLLHSAEQADDPDDTLACLQAALHAGRLRDALR